MFLWFVSLNGTGFAVIENGLSKNQFSSSGGALSNLFSSRYFSTSSQKLEVQENNSDTLELELKGKVEKVNLSSIDSEKLSIPMEEGVESNKPKNSVSSIHREITREGEITEIRSQIENGYLQATNGRELHIRFSDLESAINKIKQWEEQEGLEQQIKTSSDTRKIPILNQDERIALRTFFDVYSHLYSTRPHYHSQLQGASEGSDVHLGELSRNTQVDMPLLQDVQNALNYIQWNRSAIKIKVEHRTASGLLAHPRPYKENSYGWGSWPRNPYRHFFKDQEEFQKAMSLIDGAQEALEAYLSSKRFEGIWATVMGPAMIDYVYRDKEKYLNALRDKQSSVELHVGKKLMGWMGR